jgi:hypothetical protein
MKRTLYKYHRLILLIATFIVGSCLAVALRPEGDGVLVTGAVSSCSYGPEGPKSFQLDSNCIAVLSDGSKQYFRYPSKVSAGARVKFLCRETWFSAVRRCTLDTVG